MPKMVGAVPAPNSSCWSKTVSDILVKVSTTNNFSVVQQVLQVCVLWSPSHNRHSGFFLKNSQFLGSVWHAPLADPLGVIIDYPKYVVQRSASWSISMNFGSAYFSILWNHHGSPPYPNDILPSCLFLRYVHRMSLKYLRQLAVLIVEVILCVQTPFQLVNSQQSLPTLVVAHAMPTAVIIGILSRAPITATFSTIYQQKEAQQYMQAIHSI